MFLTLSDILGVLGILIGIIVSIYFYRKGQRLKKPLVAYRHIDLVRGQVSKLDDLVILYRNVTVKDLTITKILFWNDGFEAIKREDIAKNDPLRVITTNNVTILDIQLLGISSEVNQFTCAVSENKKEAILDFYFLGKGQGAVIQIIHTGVNPNDISIRGTIIGGEPITERRESRLVKSVPNYTLVVDNRRRRGEAFFTVFLVFWGFIIFFCGLFFSSFLLLETRSVINVFGNSTGMGSVYGWITAIMMGPTFLFMGSLLLYSAFRFWRARPPKGLELFDE